MLRYCGFVLKAFFQIRLHNVIFIIRLKKCTMLLHKNVKVNLSSGKRLQEKEVIKVSLKIQSKRIPVCRSVHSVNV